MITSERHALIGTLLLLLVGTGGAQHRLSPMFYELSEEVVTPHIPWARPLPGGPFTVLARAPGAAHRETVELAQRLELDYRAVQFFRRTRLGSDLAGPSWDRVLGATPEEVLTDLRDKLRDDYDVILLGNFQANLLPPDVQSSLLQKIRRGTGLVYAFPEYGASDSLNKALASGAGSDFHAFITTGVPFAALPAFAGRLTAGESPADFVSRRQVGAGRAALLNHGEALPTSHYLTPVPPDHVPYSDLYYEYYQSLVLKAILWAAGRTPDVLLADFPQALTFQRREFPGPALSCALRNEGRARSVQLEWTVRAAEGAVWKQETQEQLLAAGNTPCAWPLPRLPRGDYFVDLRVRADGSNLNWGTAGLRVDAELGLVSLTVSPTMLADSGTVAAEVGLGGPVPAGATLAWEVRDGHDRILTQQEQPLAPGDSTAATSLPVRDPRSVLITVTVQLQVEGQRVDQQQQQVSVVRRVWDDVAFGIWPLDGRIQEYVMRQVLRRLREGGIDTIVNCWSAPDYARVVFAENYRTVPYMTRYHFSGRPDDRIRQPCLTNRTYRQEEAERLIRNAELFAPHDPLGYTLGDECNLNSQPGDLCWSETCIADFRRYLREQYGTIAALNDEWETRFSGFEEIEPIPLEAAREQGQYAPWVDHRLHADRVFTDMFRFGRDVIRRVDPHARVGFDGPFNTVWHSGYDWWQLMQVFGLCNVYFKRSEQVELIRSFARPGTFLGHWYGGYMSGGFFGAQRVEEPFERLAPWTTLLHGGNSIWWFHSWGDAGGGTTECAVSPSLTFYPCFQWLSEEVREIKEGIGKLLMHAERQHDGIALLYSQASLHASAILPGTRDYAQALRGAYMLIEDLGLQYDFVSYEQVIQGILAGKAYQALILPQALALSAAEAEAIGRFVEQGGLVLADLRPGLTDGHGRPRPPGMLHRVFGLRWDGLAAEKRTEPAVLQGTFRTQPIAGTLREMAFDAATRLDGAKALGRAGDTPVLTVQRRGQGHAVCLNASFDGYETQRWQEGGAALRKAWGALLAGHGIRPRVRVQTPDGQEILGVEVVFHEAGDLTYLGLLKRPVSPDEAPQRAVLEIDQAAELYDMRAGREMGPRQRWEVVLKPGRAHLWALLPYVVEGVQVTPQRDRYAPGEMVTLGLAVAAGAAPGRHCVHLEVADPEGVSRPYLAHNVLLEGPWGQTSFLMALNEPSGEWTVRMRDVASGREHAASFTVAARE